MGNDVYDPLTFLPEIVHFSRKQYRFLNSYRLGVPLSEAADKAGMSVESADRFLRKPETVKWLQDRALKDHITQEWEEPSKWWHLGNEVLEGRKTFNKAQIVVFQEFGHRVCPKSKESTDNSTNIQINIDPAAVQQALKRQESIEADLVKEETPHAL